MTVMTHEIIVDGKAVGVAPSFPAACREVDWRQRNGENAHTAPIKDGWHIVASWSYKEKA